MKTIGKFGLALCLSTGLGFGITFYHGQLVDASCYNQNSNNDGKVWVTCAPTASTTSFAIHANGKIRMLNDAGNDKAKVAFKNGDLKRDKNGDMPVVVSGYRHGNTISVEGIRARGSDTSVH